MAFQMAFQMAVLRGLEGGSEDGVAGVGLFAAFFQATFGRGQLATLGGDAVVQGHRGSVSDRDIPVLYDTVWIRTDVMEL